MEEFEPEVVSGETGLAESAPVGTRRAAIKRKSNRLYKRAERERKREAKEEAALEFFNCPDACKGDEARDILRDRRNLTQEYVIEACYRAGLIAARRLKIVTNRYFWEHGVLSTLESLRIGSTQKLLPPAEDKKAFNNLFREQDQVAWWDFGCSWREQPAKQDWWDEGHRITLDEFRKLDALKTSPCDLGNVLLGRTYEDMHREWQEFFPRIDANILPENYDQRTFKDVIAGLSECHDYLKSAARGFFKSTWMRDYVACFLICYPDSRVCIASATSPLAIEIVKNIKQYWLVENDLSLFQQVFGYMCIGWTSSDEGTAQKYDCPAARLHLVGSSTYAVALGVSVSGFRATLLIGDDCSNQLNSDSPEQRVKTQRAWDLLCQIREGGDASYVFQVGTPYAQGDLLFTTIERNDRDTEKSVRISFDPALEIIDDTRRRACIEKPELYLTLEEHEVTMRFPREYSFKAARKELHTSDLKTWLQQKMLQFTLDGNLIRLNFEREELEAAIVEKAPNPDAAIHQILMAVDRAHSTQNTADRSSIAITQFHKNSIGQPSLCVLHTRADRWRTSELATQIVDVWEEYQPHTIVVEKDNAWQDLAASLQLECERRNITLNIFWRPPTLTRSAKVIRFKGLQGLLGAVPRRLTFLRGPWIEDTFAEFLWQDGIKVSSTGKQKDDRIDGISTAALFLPGLITADEAKQTQDDKEAEDRRAAMRAQHDMIFGSGTHSNVSSGRAWRNGLPTPESPLSDVGENVTRGPFNIPGLRGWRQPAPEPNKKLSFGDIQQKRF